MKQSLLLSLVIFFIFSLSGAQAGPPDDGLRGGGSCDLSAYNNSLFETESRGSGGYTAINGICAHGMYQFMPGTARELAAFQSATGQCALLRESGCANGTSDDNYGLATEACSGVQEAMQEEFTIANLRYLQDNCPEAYNAIGNVTVQGYRVDINGNRTYSEPCTLSVSGLLAGAHIGGRGGICSTVREVVRTGNPRAGDVNDGRVGVRAGTSRLHYVCRHRDLPIPSADCNPTQFPTPDGVYTPPGGSYEGYEGSSNPAGRLPESNLALKLLWVRSLQFMTEQLVTTMMQQMQIIGSFFDAKHQLETQRLFQELTADAHKKYHPSEQMCTIGTFTRNLTESERRAQLTHRAMARSMIDRQLKTGDPSTEAIGTDDRTRMRSYLDTFCNPRDNAGQMDVLCRAAIDPSQQNADINYTQTISMPLTFDVDMLDGETGETDTEEHTIFALLDNLFMNRPLPWISQAKTKLASFVDPYLEMRSLVAMRSVAQNSLSYIISEKTSSLDQETAEENTSVAPFLKAMMIEMGIGEDQVNDMIGENPSYYAQMEFLTRKIYYHPDFVSNLYDKPANVKRIAAAMTAIRSMQNWQISQALKRREMLFSILLEIQLREKQNDMETLDIPLILNTFPGTRYNVETIYEAGE